MRRYLAPELLENGGIASTTPVGQVLDSSSARQLIREDSPEIDDENRAAAAAEVARGQPLEFRIGSRNQDHVRVAQAIAHVVHDQGPPPELEVCGFAGERIVSKDARTVLEKCLRDHDRLRFF